MGPIIKPKAIIKYSVINPPACNRGHRIASATGYGFIENIRLSVFIGIVSEFSHTMWLPLYWFSSLGRI